MIFKTTHCSLIVSALTMTFSSSAAAQSNTAVSPTRYKNAVASILDCGAFKAALEHLPNANSLMRPIARTSGAAKSDFETKSDYRTRISSRLASLVGDTSRIYISSKVEKHWTSYSAESGMEALRFRAWSGLDENRLDLHLSYLSVTTGSYMGTTAMGAKRRVERRQQENLMVGVLFPRHVVEETIYFKLSGSDAAALANEGGRMHVLGELVGASSRKSGGSPSFTNPLETHTTFDEVELSPRCAYITLNGRVLDAWSFERW